MTLLARKNVQFDVIVYEMMLERYDLSRYEVLLANDVRFVSDAVCERIREFVRKGGTLIATGQTSLFTEKWEPRADYALADLFGVSCQPGLSGRYEKTVGKGRVIFYPQSVQDAAVQGNDPELLEQWLADVAAVQKKPALKVEAPDGVLASIWQKGSKRIVHLVNYRGQAGAGREGGGAGCEGGEGGAAEPGGRTTWRRRMWRRRRRACGSRCRRWACTRWRWWGERSEQRLSAGSTRQSTQRATARQAAKWHKNHKNSHSNRPPGAPRCSRRQ